MCARPPVCLLSLALHSDSPRFYLVVVSQLSWALNYAVNTPFPLLTHSKQLFSFTWMTPRTPAPVLRYLAGWRNEDLLACVNLLFFVYCNVVGLEGSTWVQSVRPSGVGSEAVAHFIHRITFISVFFSCSYSHFTFSGLRRTFHLITHCNFDDILCRIEAWLERCTLLVRLSFLFSL